MPSTDRPEPATQAHVVVLAAGRGSRLGDRGDELPKWLLEVGGRTIADRQLEGIRAAGAAVASTSVVAGHAAAALDRWLAGRPERVAVVMNPEYAEINNWWSLLRALRELPDTDPVVVINADLMIEPRVVRAFIEAVVSAEEEALLAVDLERRLTDESMKVSRHEDGTLDRIGKVGVDGAVGEYIGMLAARGGALRRLREELEAFVGRPECVNEWYEGAVGRSAAAGTPWHIWAMPGGAWVEIDDHGDLAAAESLAASQ